MNEENLRKLIESEGGSEPKRTWRCPGENELAAYVEGHFAGIKRQRLEGHFANCDWCLGVLAFLGQSVEPPEPDSVPGHLLTRARMLGKAERFKRRGWTWATATASACILIVAIFIVWRMRTEQAPSPPTDLVAQNQVAATPGVQPSFTPQPNQTPVEASEKPKRSDTDKPKIRGANAPITPAVINPREGGVISKSKAFVWNGVDGAQFYEVKVVTSDGTPLFKETVRETQLPLRLQSALQPGSEYFLAVEANLSDGRVIRSKLVKFRVAP